MVGRWQLCTMPRTEPGSRPSPEEKAGQSGRAVMAKQKAANGGHAVSKSEDWSTSAGAAKAKRVDWGAYSERAGKGALPPESGRGAPGHNPFEDDRRTSSAENEDPAVLQSDWFKLLTPQVRSIRLQAELGNRSPCQGDLFPKVARDGKAREDNAALSHYQADT